MKRKPHKLSSPQTASNAPGIFAFITLGAFICLALLSMQQESFGKVNGPASRGGAIHHKPPTAKSDAEFEHLLRAIEKVESHSDPKAVSKKGARGRFQVMPATARKPGLGVMPMRNASQAEQERFARDYLKALLRKYHGDRKLTEAAYNAGPGRVDRLIAMLPKETRDYVVKAEREYAANRE